MHVLENIEASEHHAIAIYIVTDADLVPFTTSPHPDASVIRFKQLDMFIL